MTIGTNSKTWFPLGNYRDKGDNFNRLFALIVIIVIIGQWKHEKIVLIAPKFVDILSR